MSISFAEVTDITIPEGSVERITETVGGRVLWEKDPFSKIKINPSVLAVSSDRAYTNYGQSLPIVFLNANSSGNLVSVLRGTTGSMNTDFGIVGPGISGPFISSNHAAAISSANDGIDGNNLRLYSMSQPTEAMSDGGRALIKTNGNSNYTSEYVLAKLGSEYRLYDSYLGYATVSSTPISETSVYITGSPERNEYLLTGFNAGLSVMKTTASSLTFQSSSLKRTCWASGLGASGLYFGATGTDGNASYSPDGINWTTSTVYTASNGSKVLGLVYLSQKKKICAISSNSVNVALSSDGQTWTYKRAPTSRATAYAYSPYSNVLCIVDSTKAYITRNFTDWEEIAIAGGSAVNFRDFIHLRNGLFVGYEYLGKTFYFLNAHGNISLS